MRVNFYRHLNSYGTACIAIAREKRQKARLWLRSLGRQVGIAI